MTGRIPIVGPVPRWVWFPVGPSAPWYTVDRHLTAYAAAVWRARFVQPARPAPPVYWSARVGRRSSVHGRTYPWGIVLSVRQARRIGRRRREAWIAGLVRHELLHWAGYRHGRTFQRHARALHTW